MILLRFVLFMVGAGLRVRFGFRISLKGPACKGIFKQMTFLNEIEWRRRQSQHEDVLKGYVDRHRSRQSSGDRHPTEDFLWQYFGIRPGRLLLWGPGAGVVLTGEGSGKFLKSRGFASSSEGVWIPPASIPSSRRSSMRWILQLLEATRERAPTFGCLGLHEWAMVYEEKDIRHAQLPLRLTHQETRDVVESHPVRCTHFDAFRFFSKSARPLNQVPLSSEGRPEQEQPACLHANMDLLKWHLKLTPWLMSDGLSDLFEFALQAREVDMRASPYDVRLLDLEPICIETSEGRRQYVQEQRQIADRGSVFRAELIARIRSLIELVESSETVHA